MDVSSQPDRSGEEEQPKLTKAQLKKIAKAEAKEKKRLQKIEDNKLILWDEFTRELELSRKTAEKINLEWESTINVTKIIDLKTELKLWYDKMETTLATKDEILETIIEDIDNIDILHKKSYCSHVKQIEFLDEAFKTLSRAKEEMYERQSRELLLMFLTEMNDFEKKQNDIIAHLANVEINRCLITEAEIEEDFQIYIQRMDERILQEVFRRYNLKDRILQQMQEKYDELVKFVYDLKNSGYDKDEYKKMKILFEKHENMSSQFEKLSSNEMKVNKTLSDMQRDFLSMELNYTKRLHNLELEEKYFTEAYNDLQIEKLGIYNYTTERVKILAYEGRKIVKYFQDLLTEGELLLKLAVKCRKLQTQKEKIIDHEPENIDYEAAKKFFNFHICSLNLEEHLDCTEEDLQNDFKRMIIFWKQFSDVSYQNMVLENELSVLENENKSLVTAFKTIFRIDPDFETLNQFLNIQDVNLPDFNPFFEC